MMMKIALAGLILLVGCTRENARVTTTLNNGAALVGDLPSNPMQDKVITSWVDKQGSTMSTMFGNDVAMRYARTNQGTQYPAGSVVSVVTWSQQEDPRWFGGNIPANAKSVEFVSVGPGANAYSYQRYEGSPLKKVTGEDGAAPNERAASLLSQRAAVMP
jgi:hypothetical protein